MSSHAEKPVFVSESRWRERAIRAAMAVVGAVLLLWLAALVAGALGLGGLPALRFPGTGGDARPTASPPRVSQRGTPASGTRSPQVAAPAPAAADSAAGSSHEGSQTTTTTQASGAPAPAAAELPSPAPSQAVQHGVGGSQSSPSHPTESHAQAPGAEAPSHAAPPAGGAPSPSHSTGPPETTPSGNEVPSGGRGEPSSRSEAPAEAPGRAIRGA